MFEVDVKNMTEQRRGEGKGRGPARVRVLINGLHMNRGIQCY